MSYNKEYKVYSMRYEICTDLYNQRDSIPLIISDVNVQTKCGGNVYPAAYCIGNHFQD